MTTPQAPEVRKAGGVLLTEAEALEFLQLRRLKRNVEQLIAAIRFYADSANYREVPVSFVVDDDGEHVVEKGVPVLRDGGTAAFRVLQAIYPNERPTGDHVP